MTNALVKAQQWILGNRLQTAQLLSNAGPGKYTPHSPQALAKVLASTDYADYEKAGVVQHKGWLQRRIDFQPYPFPSYTEHLVRAIKSTRIEGNDGFLQMLDPAFAARDLVDDRFVRKAIDSVGGPAVFGISANYRRQETVAV